MERTLHRRAPRFSSLLPRAYCLLPFLMLLTGCGYSTKEIYPASYRTVAVPIFENRTFYRGVEFELTEAVVKEIQDRTPYTVAGESGADTLLRGTVVRVDQGPLSRVRRGGGVPQEVEVTVVVDYEWVDLRTGRVLRGRKGFESIGRFVPTPPVSQPFEVAQRMASERLAEDLVSTMQSDW